MHPQLIDLAALLERLTGLQVGLPPIHTFGILLGAAFAAGILWGMREARKWGLDSEMIFNLSFWVIFGAIAGSRVLYIVIDLFQQGSQSAYMTNPLSVLRLWEGGLVWYGGFFGAFVCAFFYMRKYRLPVWRVGDIAIPATFFGLAIGRLGCAAVGDDFGKPIESEAFKPWGLIFNHPEALVYPPSLKGIPLHPTQLYMAAGAFIVFLLLRFVLRRKRFDGQVVFLAFVLYPINRSIIEIFRGDYQRGVVGDLLSTSQLISIPTLIAGVVMLYLLARRMPEVRVKGSLQATQERSTA